MLLDGALARPREADTPPEELRTSATVTFQPGEGITHIALAVDARVPGLDEEAFQAAAETAKENCPVSKALAGVARDQPRSPPLQLDGLDPAAPDVVDEAGGLERVGEQWVAANRLDAMAHALGQVRERLEINAFRLRSQPSVQVGVREREHAAVAVPDDDRLLRPEQVVGDDEGADRRRR